MSNALAIATVTAVLSRVLSEALAGAGQGGVENAQVTTNRPDSLNEGDADVPGINVFLYRAVANPSWATADLPTRRADGTTVRRPHQALDLHYLLTFTGDQALLEPQRLMGTAITALVTRPVLGRSFVQETIDQAVVRDAGTWLQFSDLPRQIDVVRVTWLPLDLEEFSKLWSSFLRAPYRLSISYQATVVLIDGDVTPHPALPVLTRGAEVAAIQVPVITSAVADTAPADPLHVGTTLRIEGRWLRGTYSTQVRLGQLVLPVPAEWVTGTRLTVPLPPEVTAGVLGVQVIHPRLVGDPPVERGGAESAAVPVIVRPTVSRVARVPATDAVDVEVAPPVSDDQRVVLLLNEHHPPDDRTPRAYLLPAESIATDDAAEVSTARFLVAELTAGTYVVRVQVDGAESILSTGSDGRFETPQVTIP